jgi:hypothetical protein
MEKSSKMDEKTTEYLEIKKKCLEWESCSFGDTDDLLKDEESDELCPAKLGFELPTNDKTKVGTLDNLSVDSYWVGEEEIDENEENKQKNTNEKNAAKKK